MKQLLFPLCLGVLLALGACRSQEAEENAEPSEAEVQEERSTFRTTLDAGLTRADEQLRGIEADLGSAGESYGEEARQLLARLREERARIDQDLAELDTTANEDFLRARDRLARKMNNFERDVEEFRYETIAERGDLEEALQARLNAIDREIQELEGKGAEAEAEVQRHYTENVDRLRRQRDGLAQGLTDLRQSSPAEFAERRREVADAFAGVGYDLRNAVRDIELSIEQAADEPEQAEEAAPAEEEEQADEP